MGENDRSFNPHARVGRDLERTDSTITFDVSIHTPVWGVTSCHIIKLQLLEVSIHTPVWGVTLIYKATKLFCPRFNPHARVGRDIYEQGYNDAVEVSIHTPVWGVTVYVFMICVSAH